MKAMVLTENTQLAIEERTPETTSSEHPILIRVAYAGVCGSDIPRGFDGGAYHYPLVMGHEFSATVEQAPRSSGFAPGDRVAVFPLLPDMTKPINTIGEYAVSQGYDYYGSRRDGAFQEYLTVPAFSLFRIPDRLSLLAAAMTEPCAVAYHAAARPTIAAGDRAAVIGGGPIGLMVAQWLRLRGCTEVIVSEIDPKKRAIAEELGLTVVDAANDPVAAIDELTDGGAEVVVEACGLPLTFRQAIASARLFGQVVFLGNIHGTFELSEKEFSSILRRELTIYGTWNSKVTPRGRDEWTRVVAEMERGVRVLPLISDVVPLDEGPKMLEAMHKKERWFNKVVLQVDASAPREVEA
jgi:L-iditol 2-dehydrogenase/galactitol-1-phosphate 5-dehydrogenase